MEKLWKSYEGFLNAGDHLNKMITNGEGSNQKHLWRHSSLKVGLEVSDYLVFCSSSFPDI